MNVQLASPSIEPHRPGPCRAAWVMVLAVFALFAAPLLSAYAQGPRDAGIQGFSASGEYQFLLAGELRPKAEIYFSQRAAAFLVISSDLDSPLLLSQRTGQVQTVHIMKVARRDNGTIDLLAGATLGLAGSFRLDGTDVVFDVGGKQGRLHQKAPLVGLHQRAELVEHSPEYLEGAAAYTPDNGTLARLRRQQAPVKVRILFGSWCHFCKRFLPNAIKVDEILAGSKVAFEYYGLPQPPAAWKDPEAVRLKVTGVPTGIVYINGKEAGRIQGGDWAQVERRIATLIQEKGGT